ncbi:MAG: M16 family metallopeptidase [Thermodesulfobacteriota bacterium]
MMRQHRNLFAFVLIWIILAAAQALAAPSEPVKTRLANGLTVIIEAEHSAPVVSVQMWVKVGSADEQDRYAGISHVFEHMLFKGTDTKKVGEIANMIESVGGDINAYTSFDNTVYYTTVPSRYFSTGLDVISDAVQHSSFDPAELKKELDVVLEEIRMNEDRPARNLYRSLLGNAFSVHPYKRPVIGSVETVKAITREDILRTFKKWYVPNNMTLVIAGDVDAQKALAEVKQAFKGFKRAPEPHGKRPVEPAQKGLKTSVITMDVKEGNLGMAFHIPSIKEQDTFALDVLQVVLSGGQTSRLVKRIKIDEQLVHGISAYPMSLKDPGLFFVTATLETKNIDKTIEETLEEIERLKAEGPMFDELEKAKFNIESDFVYSRETMDGIASKLGYYETLLGDPIYERRYVDEIRKVTAGDIKRVLKRYFTGGNMTVAALVPEADKGEVTQATLASTVKTAEREAQVKFAAKAEREEGTKKVTLANGITLIVKETHANPTVAFYATFPGGLKYEDKKNNGIGNFTAAMLTRGTKNRTREELAREVEDMAGSVGGFSGWNSTGVTGKFLSDYFDRGLGIFADVVLNPTFPDKEIEKLRKDLLAAVKRQEDNLPGYTFKLLKKSLFTVHPYGMTSLGEAQTISSIKREDMVRHHDTFFTPSRMVLVIVGDVRTGHAVERVKELFGGFDTPEAELPEPPAEPHQRKIRRTGAVKDKEQTHIGIGFLGTTINSEDRYPLMVMTEILSGQGGRLFLELRDRQSLAYSLSAFSRVGVDPGFVGVYIGSAPEKKERAIEEIFKELERMRTEMVTGAELNRAKKSLIGSYEIGLQEVTSQASDAATNELYGLGYDFYKEFPEKINAITAEDVLIAAKKYLTLDAYTISIVGPNGYKEK